MKQTFSDLGLDILFCDFLEIKDWTARKNAWPWWRIYWNESPGASVVYDNKVYDIRPDSFVIVSPNAVIDRNLSNSVRHFYIHVKITQPVFEVAPRVFRIPIEKSMLAIVKRITKSLTTKKDKSFFSLNESTGVYSVIYYVLCHVDLELYFKRVKDPRIISILTFLDNHFTKKLNNDKLAEKIKMSRNSFLRLFKEQTGMSPGKHLLSKRLNLAAERLKTTNESIDEIAEACSFGNRYYFSRMFKKYRGVTPALYRKYNKAF